MNKRDKLVEAIVRRQLNKILNETTEYGGLSEELYQQVIEGLNYDAEKVFDLFLELLTEVNYHTLRKYMGKFFADLQQNGYKVENTKLYDVY